MESTDPVCLNKRLESFYAELTKQNGEDYEPSCLTVMMAALDRHLKDSGCLFSLQDRTFYTSREVLNGKAKSLRDEGKGKRPFKADSINPAEEDILWSQGHLGTNSPHTLIWTLWWVLNEQVGGRGQEGHHELRIEEFSLCTDDAGREYLNFVEGPRKTRQGGLYFKPRPVFPRIYRTNMSRCPVTIFELYKSKRPNSIRDKGALYLSPITRPATDVWYKDSQMGVNKLSSIVKDVIKGSPLESNGKRYSNHSVRKATVKKLRSQGISKEDVRTVTGHKRAESLDAYDSGDENTLYQLSTTLSGANAEKADTEQIRPLAALSPLAEIQRQPTKQNQTIYNGHVYNITISDCGNVNLPTSSGAYTPKRLKRILDSSPENSQ